MNHDQNFKNLILDYPREALAFFAADEVGDIRKEAVRITPIRQEQLKARLGERYRELDVPLLVEWPDGRREALLFVIEEESEAGRFSIHRLAHYCLDLSALLETRRVVPVVIFLRGECPVETLTLGGDRHDYLSFHYLGCCLSQLDALELQDSDNIVVRLNLPNMAYPPESRVDIYAQATRGLMTLESDWHKQAKYLDFIDIYAGLDDNEKAIYERRYPEEAKKVSAFAERFIEKGREKGREEGREEGRVQGEAEVLLKLLQIKFGVVPDSYRQRIESADADTLLTWAERILTAETIEAIFT